MRLRLEPAHDFRSKVFYGDNTFHLRDIFIDEEAYLEILRQFLTESIENSSKKVALIGKYIKTIKQFFGDLESFQSESFSWLLYIIYYECNDSQIVKEVLSAFDFPMWVFYSNDCDSEILDFFLYHARLSECNVWKNYTRGDPIIGCFLHKKYDFVDILLKYINVPCFVELDYSFNTLQRKSKLLTSNTRNPILIDYYRGQPARERRISMQRNFLALMILDLFENLPSDEGVLALRLLWRAIADSFFTLSEWMLAFGNQLDPEILQQVDKFYSEIIEEDTSLRSPRTLQQHCRVTIRKTLYDCQKLPNGIELLNLDSRSKAFLRLEN
ncbi:unnamed protein product [Larinioides sclopetarius]|uniref:SOCS box domain-containing protein n=1 Tax=Larinioides sclopetarius TaxID=280406 RepID=A0AAV2BHU9_9ARAC